MRLFADTNIVAHAVRALRRLGHDVLYSAERPSDPGDAALLAEAYADQRIFLTKDHDIGALVFDRSAAHYGILLIDDLGDFSEETELLTETLQSHGTALVAGAFVRAGRSGVRVRD